MGQSQDDRNIHRSFWSGGRLWFLVWLVMSAFMIVGAPSKEKK